MDEHWHREIERARKMTPDERIREGFRLFEKGRDYITSSIVEAFPEASPDDILRLRDMILRYAKRCGIT